MKTGTFALVLVIIVISVFSFIWHSTETSYQSSLMKNPECNESERSKTYFDREIGEWVIVYCYLPIEAQVLVDDGGLVSRNVYLLIESIKSK